MTLTSYPVSSTGDYFGILKEARVTTFPFNVLDNPMYWGSTANYLGWALMLVLGALRTQVSRPKLNPLLPSRPATS